MNRKIYRHKPTGELFRQTNTLEIRGMEDMESDGLTLPIWLVEQSDDWEEVKEEPNYLITAFRNKSGDLFNIHTDGLYYCKTWFDKKIDGLDLECCLDGDELSIYSIKSKEGKEFTIGDKVFFQNFDIKGEVFTIDNFFINKEDVVLARSGTDRYAICENIRTINKVKSLIYTTTDGVEIFEGDKPILYLLDSNLTFKNVHTVPCFRGFSKQDKEVADRYLTFTSEENRDKYIKENSKKPVFVSADNVEFYDNNTDFGLFSVLPKANWQENRYRLNDIIKWPKKEWLHFHTKEARQEYIDTNKPKYSLADVFMASEKIPSGHLITTGMLDQLKKLGK